MTRTPLSLIDVLEPPVNTWLRTLGRRTAELPVGVRVVRFSDADDETGLELTNAAKPASKQATPESAHARASVRPDSERLAA